jgi:hypothetical protein
MASRNEYLDAVAKAEHEAAEATDPALKAAWRLVADGWADLARIAERRFESPPSAIRRDSG